MKDGEIKSISSENQASALREPASGRRGDRYRGDAAANMAQMWSNGDTANQG